MQELFKYKESEQYINLLQENISRMSDKSSNCKNLMITLCAGAMTLQIATSTTITAAVLAVGIVLTFMFWMLDGYYLGQEKKMRDIEVEYLEKVRKNEDTKEDLFVFQKKDTKKCYWNEGLKSKALICMYLPLLIIEIIFMCYLIF